jgi:hypothetical protein
VALIRRTQPKLENGKRWAQLPSKPVIKDGAVVKGDDGKITYLPIMSFASHAVADAFSGAVIGMRGTITPPARQHLSCRGRSKTRRGHQAGSYGSVDGN